MLINLQSYSHRIIKIVISNKLIKLLTNSKMRNTKLWTYTSIIMAMIFWSLSFIWYKIVYQFYQPITVVFLRLFISSIFLFLITVSLNKIRRIKKKDFKLFIILAFFSPFLYFIGESFGVKLVSSSLAAVIVSTIPLFTPIAAYYFFRERLSFMNFTGIIISFIGVIFVIFNQGIAVNISFPGIALMFFAVASAIGYVVVIKKLSGNYNTLTIVTYQNSFGLIYFTPLFFIFGFQDFMTVDLSFEVLIPILKLAIFASTFALIFFTFSLKKIGITRANTFSNAIPVFTVIFAYFILGEELNILKLMGIFFVVTGLFLSQLNRLPFNINSGIKKRNK